jgi:hypothetical protein
MKHLTLVVFTVALAGMAVSRPARADEVGRVQIGEKLPELKGQLLTGEKAELPATTRDRIALLVLGFTYDSRFSVEEWSSRFRETFADDPGVTLFEVPMLGGMARLGRWFIDSGMRKGTPPELHANVMTVYGGVGDWKKRVGFSDDRKDAAYLILLGPDGVVRWLYTGPADDDAFDALAAAVRSLQPGA